ncbi:MAG: anhydro-N-acetylmuramic acid kinase [Chloroflexota bacterium]|nr:anhydro-N-acetylmuramic acid kinase [Chloroflexota bacterium]
MNLIGLMSGTSADGVDAALVKISGTPPDLKVREIAFLTQPYDNATQAAILDLCRSDAPLLTMGRAHVLLGHRFAEAALAVIARAGLTPADITLIGSHGQTIYHAPDGDPPFTLQIGDPAIIATRTGIATVADFRAADVATGGQGAPLVPYPDWLMYHHPNHTRALQNIGGIANVTYLPAGGGPETAIAFDTGPGNVIIDSVVTCATGGAWRYDQDGTLASQGRVDEALLAHLLDHPYLRRIPPKSTGRETFGATFAADLREQAQARGLPLADLVATVTAFTAASIADAYRRWLPAPPDEVFLCGGGADNPTLVRMLREHLARVFDDPVPIVRHYDETGYSSAAKEAVAFAILAYETWHSRPGNLPQVTGASHPVILGHVTPAPHHRPTLTPHSHVPPPSRSLASLLPLTSHVTPDGHLRLAGHDTVALAERHGTPLYLYDGATLWHRLAELRETLARHYPGSAQVAYAAKAGFTPGLARRLRAANVGLDVVSGGEMAVAREAGFDPARVHLHGNNKSRAELCAALDWGIGRIVVDNLDELGRLDALAAELGQRVSVWLRLTPALDVDTHPYRKTGHAASKFGLHMLEPNCPATQALARVQESAWLNTVGLHTHLGSQIFDPTPYAAAVEHLLDFASHHLIPAELSPGGGWGTPYVPEDPAPPVDEWIAAVSQAVIEGCRAQGWPLPHLIVEPGRWLIAPAAVALYRVGTRKTAADGTLYVAVDGGLADNPRPALYGARYTAFLANRATEPPSGAPVTVVGRFCESSDVLARDVRLPQPRPGDLLAIPVAGAYQLSMASLYNLVSPPTALWLGEDRSITKL